MSRVTIQSQDNAKFTSILNKKISEGYTILSMNNNAGTWKAVMEHISSQCTVKETELEKFQDRVENMLENGYFIEKIDIKYDHIPEEIIAQKILLLHNQHPEMSKTDLGKEYLKLKNEFLYIAEMTREVPVINAPMQERKKDLANNIELRRRSNHMSTATVAKLMSEQGLTISESHIQQWENGEKEPSTVEFLVFCKVTGVADPFDMYKDTRKELDDREKNFLFKFRELDTIGKKHIIMVMDLYSKSDACARLARL